MLTKTKMTSTPTPRIRYTETTTRMGSLPSPSGPLYTAKAHGIERTTSSSATTEKSGIRVTAITKTSSATIEPMIFSTSSNRL